MHRKLYVSFTAVIRSLAKGTVTDEDLAAGLFYFGCVREHAFEPWKASKDSHELTWFFQRADGSFDADAAAAAHRRLISALERGETEGRVVWRIMGEHNSYAQINELLTRNGLSALQVTAWDAHYAYESVAEFVQTANLPLTVVH